MRTLFSILGWTGNLALLIPSLILIVAQWGPESMLPYSDFIPSDQLFCYAFYGAIIFAILVPLSIFKIANNDESRTVLTWVKYIVLFLLSVVLGLILGYAGTIKAGYLLGNTVMKDSLTDDKPVQTVVIEKTHNTVRSRYAYCEYEFNTTIGTGDITWYEKMFSPTQLCVTSDVYNDVSNNEGILLLGKGNESLGFFMDKILTNSNIEKIKELSEEKTEGTEENTDLQIGEE